jgi:hypothetical protein
MWKGLTPYAQGVKMKNRINQDIEKAAIVGEAYARVITPKRTGLLAASWSREAINNGQLLINPIYYGVYVNDGTDKIAPRNMTGQIIEYMRVYLNSIDRRSS